MLFFIAAIAHHDANIDTQWSRLHASTFAQHNAIAIDAFDSSGAARIYAIHNEHNGVAVHLHEFDMQV